MGGVSQLRVVDLDKNAATVCSTPLLSEEDSIRRLCFDGSALQCVASPHAGCRSWWIRAARPIWRNLKQTFAPCALANLEDANMLAFAGLTPSLSPILYVFDVRKTGNFELSHVFKRAFSQAVPAHAERG